MAAAYEDLTQRVLTLIEADRTVQWGVADYAREAMQDLGMAAKQLASDWGFAASTIYKMVKVAACFPDPAQRNPELSFSHYLIAATTPDPDHWIAQAADAQWSTRDLRDAIHTAQAADPQEARQIAFDRALQRLRKVWEATDEADRMERAAAITAWYWDAIRPAVARALGDSR